MKKMVLFLIALVTLCLPLSAKEVIAGWEAWKPYQYENKAGKLTGLDIEILKNAYAAVNYQVKFSKRPWKRVLVELETGKLNIAMSASKTKEREKKYYFSDPYRADVNVLIVKKNASVNFKIKKLADLKKYDFKMGVIRGTYYGEEFKKLVDNKILTTEEIVNEIQNIKKLLAGRIDGFVANKVSILTNLKEGGYLDKVEIHPYEVLRNELHFMLSKKSITQKDVKKLNEGLRIIKKNGQYDKIIKTFIPE